MQKKQTKIAGILLVLCCVLALIVFFQTRPDTAAGEKHITISVVHSDSSKSTFSYDTDAEYLGEALTEQNLAEGTEGPYGMFITTVDGETADRRRNGQYRRRPDSHSGSGPV